MAKLFAGKGFDTKGKEELDGFDALPAGKYEVVITKSEVKRNSKDTGDLLKFTFKIMEGKFKNRLVFTSLNITHVNKQTEEIATRSLVSIVKACGKVTCDDTDELHGIQMEIALTVKPASPNFPEGNNVKGYGPSKSGGAKPSNPNKAASGDEPETSTNAASNPEVKKKKSRKVKF